MSIDPLKGIRGFFNLLLFVGFMLIYYPMELYKSIKK